MSPNTTNSAAEERLRDLDIDLPRAPSPLGAYVEAVQTGNLLFLSGTLPLPSSVSIPRSPTQHRNCWPVCSEQKRHRLAWFTA